MYWEVLLYYNALNPDVTFFFSVLGGAVLTFLCCVSSRLINFVGDFAMLLLEANQSAAREAGHTLVLIMCLRWEVPLTQRCASASSGPAPSSTNEMPRKGTERYPHCRGNCSVQDMFVLENYLGHSSFWTNLSFPGTSIHMKSMFYSFSIGLKNDVEVTKRSANSSMDLDKTGIECLRHGWCDGSRVLPPSPPTWSTTRWGEWRPGTPPPGALALPGSWRGSPTTIKACLGKRWTTATGGKYEEGKGGGMTGTLLPPIWHTGYIV